MGFLCTDHMTAPLTSFLALCLHAVASTHSPSLSKRPWRTMCRKALQQGYISLSTSPRLAGFFFVEKKRGSLGPCIDYRSLKSLWNTHIPYLWFYLPWNNYTQHGYSPNWNSEVPTICYASVKALKGRWHLASLLATLNTAWCHMGYLVHQVFSSIW